MMSFLLMLAKTDGAIDSGSVWILIVGALLAALLVLVGLFFTLVATVGFIRLPDLFSRMHVTSIIETVGAPMILLGVAVYLGSHALADAMDGNFVPANMLAGGKLILAIIFLLFTSPLVGHFLSRAALEMGYAADVVRGMQDAKAAADGSVTSDPDDDLGHSIQEVAEIRRDRQKEAEENAKQEDES